MLSTLEVVRLPWRRVRIGISNGSSDDDALQLAPVLASLPMVEHLTLVFSAYERGRLGFEDAVAPRLRVLAIDCGGQHCATCSINAESSGVWCNKCVIDLATARSGDDLGASAYDDDVYDAELAEDRAEVRAEQRHTSPDDDDWAGTVRARKRDLKTPVRQLLPPPASNASRYKRRS